MLKHPRHGYGKNMNPCIDCKVLILKKAAEYMREIGASFIATGEVLGERPMSQRRDALALIEKEAGLQRLVLRPLSARLLEATIPEESGLVNREALLDIHGRSRKPQMELAARFSITQYPSPAGGCLLTDPGFSRRLADLLRERPDFDSNDVQLLKVGRHFRLGPAMRAVVGRDDADNQKILALARRGDTLMELTELPGPLTLCRGPFTPEALRRAGSIAARYSKGRSLPEVEIRCSNVSGCADGAAESFTCCVPPREYTDVGAERIGGET
jgi:hypothetical protein